jgi:hypothetical protein
MGPLREAMKCAMQRGLEAAAIKDVVLVYGKAFQSRVYVWFQLARMLTPEKRAVIKKHKDFNQSWIFENKYLLGEGVNKKYLMTAASFELAVNLALWVANHGRLS